MSNLAFYASPIDFQKNDILNNKIHETKRNKMNSSILKKLTELNNKNKPSEGDIQSIHSNSSMKEENEMELADFYQSEMNQDLKKSLMETRMKENIHHHGINTDYTIKNNTNMNIVGNDGLYRPEHPESTLLSQKDILSKLNRIINMFEEQKEIKTSQKNEEIVLYCFLGVFVIYVLDSFVYIGKYSR